jgi:hypothetical protein
VDLICYLHPGWVPLIRPAPATRPWMDRTPESFAYRCLPLNIANAHGWEILSPHGFEAAWDGGTGPEAVRITPDPGHPAAAVSLFGQGTITFHVEGIIRTSPGWNLWVGGSPNRMKDAIAPLTGVIETDWSPFTFTMNWRFTRPRAPVRFEAMEPFCFLFPVQRQAIEAFEPRFEPLDADPETMERFLAWSRARDAFHERMRTDPPAQPSDRWQKHYYRGVDASGASLVDDHKAKLRLRPFGNAAGLPKAPADDAALPEPPPSASPPATAPLANPGDPALRRDLAKREWLLETLERQRALSPAAAVIERRADLSPEEFLDRYYALNRPVVLTGAMADWPALRLWTPDYLKQRVGGREIEYQGGRDGDPRFELDKDAHRRRMPFDAFIDRITGTAAGNDAYITAYNSAANAEALKVLARDQRPLDAYLDPAPPNADGMMWIGPAGSFTPLHHDLTNNFIAQAVGSKRILIVPAAEVGRLYNAEHVFSQVGDLEAPNLDIARFPRLEGLRVYTVVLAPGEILFTPLAWWHQVRALDFSVTLTYTNFRWDNGASATYPG